MREHSTSHRISAIDFSRARALSDLRKACQAAITGKDGVFMVVEVTPRLNTFRLVAWTGPIRLEHHVLWQTPYPLMAKECESIARALQAKTGLRCDS
jgi:hypothetical protein